jgi:dienelactone hydrolase
VIGIFRDHAGALAVWLLFAVVVPLALVLAGCGADRAASPTSADRPARRTVSTGEAVTTSEAVTLPAPSATAASVRPRRRAHPRPARPSFAVGLRVLTFVDHSRLVRIPGAGIVPRKLVTVVRYPAVGPPSGVDIRGAPPERGAGPFPLVVFGHGFAVTPAMYAALMRAWVRAGYIVAAPVFPLENANAPGGPDESDLVNQPRDMSFVISRMLAAGGVLAGLIDPREIAVSGQSDGGETALAVAYDRHFVDRRVRAAMILSGAEIPGVRGFDFPAPSPPLLATQGTADPINPPGYTHAFFDIAPAPKYLLTLPGATHLGPYTGEQPQLGIVERVTIAFLDRYLKDAPGAARRLVAVGDRRGIAALQADP